VDDSPGSPHSVGVPPIVDAMTRHLLDDVATTSLFRGSDPVADGYPTPPSWVSAAFH
jgi:hypothetical protein